MLALLSGGYLQTGMLLLLLTAAIMGFLCFNLRNPWRRRAVVFMGDAGSTMLGFLLTWFAIDLSQGPQPAMSPITAVWILGRLFFLALQNFGLSVWSAVFSGILYHHLFNAFRIYIYIGFQPNPQPINCR